MWAILWLLSFHMQRNFFPAYTLNMAVVDACFLFCMSVFLASKCNVLWALTCVLSMLVYFM